MNNVDIIDHLPTFLKLYLNHNEVNHTEIEFRRITQLSLDKFVRELACVDWRFIFYRYDVGVATGNFITKLNYICCKHFPLKLKYLY